MNEHILGVGTDIVDARRIETAMARHGERFLQRIFTEGERAYAETSINPRRTLLRYANRFAAKEAAYKALSGGTFTPPSLYKNKQKPSRSITGISWQDIEVLKDTSSGKPLLHFTGTAKRMAALLMHTTPYHHLNTQLSLSDDYPYSIAFVVLSINR